jgi:hypothetical protein
MGFTSFFMLDLPDIDSVIIAMRADPFDPDDAFLEVHGDNKAVAVTLEIEDDPVSADDACGGIEAPDIGCTAPPRPANFVEPCIYCRLDSWLILVASARSDEFPQRPPRNDPHPGHITLYPKWAQADNKLHSAEQSALNRAQRPEKSFVNYHSIGKIMV